MEAVQKYILALFVLAGSLEVLGQVSSLCRPNERFLTCGGCQSTCDQPTPACAAVCRVGCYCPDNLVRDKDGLCIPLSKCPSTVTYNDESTEPREVDHTCPADEEYRFCEPCNKTCDNPNPICPAQCSRGCFCKGDLVRDRDGKCVAVQQCRKKEQFLYNDESTEPREVDHACPADEEYRFCEPCNKTCDNPNPICPAQCSRGCFCKGDLVRDRDGKCVAVQQCRKKEQFLYNDESTEPREVDHACPADEEYRFCEPCNKTCDNPNPICPAQCSRGCFCKGDLVRDRDGKCVAVQQCGKEEKSNLVKRSLNGSCVKSEEYRACSKCEPSCGPPSPLCLVADCQSGCFCRGNLVRSPTGHCIGLHQCPEISFDNTDEDDDDIGPSITWKA